MFCSSPDCWVPGTCYTDVKGIHLVVFVKRVSQNVLFQSSFTMNTALHLLLETLAKSSRADAFPTDEEVQKHLLNVQCCCDDSA